MQKFASTSLLVLCCAFVCALLLSQSTATPLSSLPQYSLPPLAFNRDDLEPIMGAKTVELHYSKHHAGYLAKFNLLLERLWNDYPTLRGQFFDDSLTLVDFLRLAPQLPVPVRQQIINQGGGFVNHNIFWDILRPIPAQHAQNIETYQNPGPAVGSLLQQLIVQGWGSFESFENSLLTTGEQVFGSGWVWVTALCSSPETEPILAIETSKNQDLPPSGIPIAGIDVFEHAYYLDYFNNRSLFLKNIAKIIQWDIVNDKLVTSCHISPAQIENKDEL